MQFIVLKQMNPNSRTRPSGMCQNNLWKFLPYFSEAFVFVIVIVHWREKSEREFVDSLSYNYEAVRENHFRLCAELSSLHSMNMIF